ncbi:MAG TPA: rhodanese-like domain-containing protein [Candidatus Eisenbacteria bacterium]|nr:rhodanese-like domain-containing protein [Candidatus Eisenbacteria bacterium]
MHRHSPGYVALVDDARTRVSCISIPEYNERLMRREHHVLIDVREDHEWAAGRLPGAMHLSRGVLEREIESNFADKTTPLVLYCAAGNRSVLAAESLQRMGYTNVVSLDGGFRGWREAGLPIETDDTE